MNKLELSVIAPCFNEEKNIPELVERLLATFLKKNISGEIILVDDYSTDSTRSVIEALARKHPSVKGVYHPKNKGMFAAWRSGLSSAAGTYVCFIDADLQNMPEDVWRLLKEIKYAHTDIVQGYRSSVGRLKDSRYILSRGMNFLLNALFGMRARDNKSGFIIAHREVLEDILHYHYNYYYPQTFLTVAATAKGYHVRELETLFQSRLAGESFITKNPFRPTILSFIDIAKAFFEFRIFFKQDSALSSFLADHSPRRQDEPLTWWRKLLFEFYFLTLPLHAWMIDRTTKTYYEELKKTQWLSPEDIKKLQERKLRKLMWHAYNHVGYYRQVFDSLGLTPESIRTIEDLQKLPMLSKDNVRENLYFDLLSNNHDKKKILRITTSGSTGQPFTCYADKHQLEMRWAATLRSMEWTGYKFGDRQMRLWHQTIGMSLIQIVREKIDAILSRRKFIPAYEMTAERIVQFIKKLKRYKPVLIDGYAESFNFLSQYIKQEGIEGIVPPKGIISSAQTLPDQSRAIIEKAFGCSVFDKYGSREFSGIAYESDGHDGHLVIAENYVVEIIKDGRPALPGEVGEIVITDLNNFCMPFIRYRVGDLAVAVDNSRPSPCGRGLPRIGKIEGRIQSIVIGANGNYVPGALFPHLFKDYDHIIRQYKVMQDKPGEVTLLVVKALRFEEKQFTDIMASLYKFLGEKTKIDVKFVDEIPMVRTGKQQGSISTMKIDFQNLEGSVQPSSRKSEQLN